MRGCNNALPVASSAAQAAPRWDALDQERLQQHLTDLEVAHKVLKRKFYPGRYLRHAALAIRNGASLVDVLKARTWVQILNLSARVRSWKG